MQLQNEKIANLGLLSIYGQNHETSALKEAPSNADGDAKPNLTFLPLVVNHHKGSSYN
jgi:hypothetical protein